MNESEKVIKCPCEISPVVGLLTNDPHFQAVLTAYATKLLEESDRRTHGDLGAALASYLDGYEDGVAHKEADS